MKNLITRELAPDIMEITIDQKRLGLIPKAVEGFQKDGFQILFTTDETLIDFQVMIGKEFSKKIPNLITKEVINENDPMFFELVGKMTLDYYVPNTYFIKSTKDKTVYEIRGKNDKG